MERCLLLTMVAIQVIMLLILFMFQHKHLKWNVHQPEKFNHNIFSGIFLFLLFAVQWL